jgi:Divergent InlB B-repeat domain
VRKALFLFALVSALWLAPGALASGARTAAWCGSVTDESSTDRPDLVTGAQVHAIVATPADAPDQFGADANRLADDIASMSNWWAGQDSTRLPRFDTATFSGVLCPDISFVRLPEPASAYQGSTAFGAVRSAIATSGFVALFKDYLVYYDGPSVEEDICGTGGGDFNQGGGFAIVWLNGCPDVPSDAIATHELLHAFGASFTESPNDCPPPNDHHPCDSTTDVLYPFADTTPLAQLVLDFNHDDYYGHSGSWPDIQDSIFLHHVNTPEEALGVTISGVGSVTSDLPGVACTASCTTQWDEGTAVTLTPDPGAGSRFVHWTGGCIGSADCVLDLSKATAVNAVFGPSTIPVKVSTTGKGRVACSPACSKRFAAGTRLNLRAIPAKGWKFASWGGACAGSRITCTPKTDSAVAVRANFKKKR